MKKSGLAFVLGFAVSLGAVTVAGASTIVVNNDEWTLSDAGFAAASDTGVFVTNLVAELGSTIHAYSTNFGLTGGQLANAMSSAGATFSTGTGFAFTQANLSAYDAILLGGNYLSATEIGELQAYVGAGGNVYIAGGTGNGGPATEAAAWNGFLSAYGIQMASVYNGISGVQAVSGDPLFNGVSGLYVDNGNGLSGSNVVCCGNDGLYGVYRDTTAPVPLPAGGLLLIGALGGLGSLARRQRRN